MNLSPCSVPQVCYWYWCIDLYSDNITENSKWYCDKHILDLQVDEFGISLNYTLEQRSQRRISRMKCMPFPTTSLRIFASGHQSDDCVKAATYFPVPENDSISDNQDKERERVTVQVTSKQGGPLAVMHRKSLNFTSHQERATTWHGTKCMGDSGPHRVHKLTLVLRSGRGGVTTDNLMVILRGHTETREI